MVLFLKLNEPHDLKKPVNISGIINTPIISFTFAKKKNEEKILNRLGVILPCRSQIILEIWSNNETSTPKFAQNWKILQLITIFDVSYGGETFLEGKKYKVFRLGCKWEHKFGRFIWLSTESPMFWYKPISQLDILVNPKALARESWPRRVPFGSGSLRISRGSVISKHWSKLFPKWHTRDYDNFTFENLVSLHETVKRGVNGFLNLLTKQKMYTWANFER